MFKLLLLILLFVSTNLLAAEEAPPPPAMSNPPGSSSTTEEAASTEPESSEEVVPQVTIIQKGETTIEEYRANGFLYMVKITPKKGAPYYLIDDDGDGSLETRRNELSTVVVPRWVLFRW